MNLWMMYWIFFIIHSPCIVEFLMFRMFRMVFYGPIDDVPYRALSNMTGVDLSNSTVHYREENNGDTNTDFVYILNEAGAQTYYFSNYFGMVYLLDLNAMVTTYFVHGKSDRHVVELTNPESLSRDSASSYIVGNGMAAGFANGTLNRPVTILDSVHYSHSTDMGVGSVTVAFRHGHGGFSMVVPTSSGDYKFLSRDSVNGTVISFPTLVKPDAPLLVLGGDNTVINTVTCQL